MSGHRPFSELTKDFTPERRRRIEAKKAELRAAMPLHELRQAQGWLGITGNRPSEDQHGRWDT